MRVMILHKSTPDTEAGKIPPMDLIQRVGQMIGEMKAAVAEDVGAEAVLSG